MTADRTELIKGTKTIDHAYYGEKVKKRVIDN